jgi:hypothetical protein
VAFGAVFLIKRLQVLFAVLGRGGGKVKDDKQKRQQKNTGCLQYFADPAGAVRSPNKR